MKNFSIGVDIQENVNIKDYSTLKVGGFFRYFTVLEKKEDLPQLYAIAHNDEKYKNTPLFILGGGSNSIFSDGVLDIFAVKIDIKGFEIIKEDDQFVEIKVGAGEVWDKFVERTVEMKLSGVESLSAIPGVVGATPVQNVGAYGVEVKDSIVSVEVFDTFDNTIKVLSNSDCKFGYRDSIFKNKAKGRYIITSVVYRLSKLSPLIPKYPDTERYFREKNITNPNVSDIREAIIFIRSNKLPNPKEIPNVGSFFKNPIVPKEQALKILADYPNAKFFPVNDSHMKVPAGWLIENAGLKGRSFGNVAVYDKNALVLVNTGNATKEDIMNAKNEIIRIVKEKFGITLEQEPEII